MGIKVADGTKVANHLTLNRIILGNSLEVQRLGLRTSTAGDMGSIPVRGIKIPHAPRHGQINK